MGRDSVILPNGTKAAVLEVSEDTLRLQRRPWGYHLIVSASGAVEPQFNVIAIDGTLELRSPGQFAIFGGVVRTHPRPLVCKRRAGFDLRVDIDERTLADFETARLRHAGADVEIVFRLGLMIQQRSGALSGGSCEIGPKIPRSRWATILQGGGFALTALHRFPVLALVGKAGDRYRATVDALRRAEQLLADGHPTPAAGQCRNALNMLASVAFGGAEFDQNAMGKLLKGVKGREKHDRFLQLWKGLLATTCDPHHPETDVQTGKEIEYTPDEAAYVLTMTTATLEFIALLLAEKA